MPGYVWKRSVFDGVIFAYLITVGAALILPVMAPKTFNEDWLLSQMSLVASIEAAVFFLGGILSLVCNKAHLKTLGQLVFAPSYVQSEQIPEKFLKTLWGWQLLITFLVTFLVGVSQTEFSILELTNEAGFAGAVRLFRGLLSPNFDLLPKAILKIIETIYIAFMATVIAIPVAFVLSFLCAKNIMRHPLAFGLYGFLRTFLKIGRAHV